MGPWLDCRVMGSCLAPSREHGLPHRSSGAPGRRGHLYCGLGWGCGGKGGRRAGFSPSEVGPPAGSSEDYGSGTVGSLGDSCCF